jgi:hypothetical protein
MTAVVILFAVLVKVRSIAEVVGVKMEDASLLRA